MYLPERVSRAIDALNNEPLPRAVNSFLAHHYPWGSDTETLKRFHIGAEPNSWGLPAVLFPMRQLDGTWFYSRRSVIDGPKYEHEKGATPPLYLPLPPQERVVYLTEGHTDTLTARWLGLPAMGLMGASSYREHLDYLQGFDEVRVVMDADPAGWKAASELYRSLCNVRLMLVYTPDIFVNEKLFKKTRRPDPRCIEKMHGHGEHAREGITCVIWQEPYCDQKLDLTDLTKQWPGWTRYLTSEGEDIFVAGHRSCSHLSRAGCRRCGAQLEGAGLPQAGLPQARELQRPLGAPSLRGRPLYLGVRG